MSNCVAATIRRAGHFFCDRCDDVAFGEVCRECGQTARFVQDEPPRRSARVSCRQPVSPQRGRELFSQLHRQLDGAVFS